MYVQVRAQMWPKGSQVPGTAYFSAGGKVNTSLPELFGQSTSYLPLSQKMCMFQTDNFPTLSSVFFGPK